jgi:hypothetical protein
MGEGIPARDTVGRNRPARHAGGARACMWPNGSATWANFPAPDIRNARHHDSGAAIRCLPLLPADDVWIIGSLFSGQLELAAREGASAL